VKTSKAVLAAGLMAGLATLPLSARADTAAPDLPHGSASASAVTVQLSLAPIKNVGANGVLGWQNVVAALTQLRDALCTDKTTATGCPLGLTFPTDLPDALKVSVAQARDDATLTAGATDVLSGTSASAPVATDWKVLNANIGALEDQIAAFINNGSSALASGGVPALTAFLQSGQLNLNVPALGTADLSILGSVAATLGQKGVADNPWSHADAVAIKLNGNTVPQLQGTSLSVDPFNAYALNGATTRNGKTGPEVSAANTTAALGLPALLVNNSSAANMSTLTSLLHSLVDALTKAIADPSQAGSILSSVPGVPAPLQGALTTIGGLVNQTVGTVTGATGTVTGAVPVDVSALKLWDAKLSAALDGLTALNTALNGLNLPDVANLVSVKDSIATAKTVPVTGGGVASSATARVGQLAVLPVGDQLATTINSVLGNVPKTAGITLAPLTASTPLLSIDGITSTADAAVGPGTKSPLGTAGLNKVSVLGQTINLDQALPNLNGATPDGVPTIQPLGPGEEWHHVFTVPGVGSVTLDITRGVQQTVADTADYRSVNMAALDLRLINGNVGCSTDASKCHDLVPGTTTAANAAAPRAASSGSGVSALGADGTDVVRASVALASADAGMHAASVTPGCSTPGSGPNCPLTATESLTSLPQTGMLGGFAIPAGLLLMAVAISLRVVPGLWSRARRVR
jgi:hypothetical protein